MSLLVVPARGRGRTGGRFAGSRRVSRYRDYGDDRGTSQRPMGPDLAFMLLGDCLDFCPILSRATREAVGLDAAPPASIRSPSVGGNQPRVRGGKNKLTHVS